MLLRTRRNGGRESERRQRKIEKRVRHEEQKEETRSICKSIIVVNACTIFSCSRLCSTWAVAGTELNRYGVIWVNMRRVVGQTMKTYSEVCSNSLQVDKGGAALPLNKIEVSKHRAKSQMKVTHLNGPRLFKVQSWARKYNLERTLALTEPRGGAAPDTEMV